MARTDGFEELHELLNGAGYRYRSARATIVLSVEADVAEKANRRFVDWRFAQPGGSGLGILRTEDERRAHGPDVPPDFYRSYEDTERTVHLRHERPDRWREEGRLPDGPMLCCVVFGGARGPRWIYEPPQTAIHDAALSEPWPRQDPYTDLSFMLDPSEEFFSYALLDDAIVHKTGRRTTAAGREATEVRVVTVSWGYPPDIFQGYEASMEGATDHMLLVDRQTGTLLRVVARLDGREFRIAEVEEISYDQRLPEGAFRLDLPGVEFR